MDDKALTAEIEKLDPMTDTGKAIKYFLELRLEDSKRLQDVTAAVRQIQRNQEEERTKEAKEGNVIVSFIKACRNAAAKFVGDVDTHVLK